MNRSLLTHIYCGQSITSKFSLGSLALKSTWTPFRLNDRFEHFQTYIRTQETLWYLLYGINYINIIIILLRLSSRWLNFLSPLRSLRTLRICRNWAGGSGGSTHLGENLVEILTWWNGWTLGEIEKILVKSEIVPGPSGLFIFHVRSVDRWFILCSHIWSTLFEEVYNPEMIRG